MVKRGAKVKGFGKGWDQTLIIRPFVRKNWVIEIQRFPRVHNHRWGESAEWQCSERGASTLIIGEQMLRCAFARSVVRWLMRPFSWESVVKRNTLWVDVEEPSTACIVANSLSSQDENYEVNLLIAVTVLFMRSHPITSFLHREKKSEI